MVPKHDLGFREVEGGWGGGGGRGWFRQVLDIGH